MFALHYMLAHDRYVVDVMRDMEIVSSHRKHTVVAQASFITGDCRSRAAPLSVLKRLRRAISSAPCCDILYYAKVYVWGGSSVINQITRRRAHLRAICVMQGQASNVEQTSQGVLQHRVLACVQQRCSQLRVALP